jgi:hypothetical protein
LIPARRVVTDSDRVSGDQALEIDEVAGYLQENLGERLTALLAGLAEPSGVRRWANRESRPPPPAERRLREACEVFQLVLSAESTDTVRAWFIGRNPELGDESPVEAIAGGRFREVMAAARVFVAGG